MSADDQKITEIPLIDIRQSSLVQVAKDETVRGRLLINASKTSFGLVSKIASYLFIPLGDFLAKWWLKKSDNPYKAEINGMAKELAIKGVHALNLSYEWGCTSGAYQKENEVLLVRVLDWPFPSLGECTVVAHMNGKAGDFYNVTWPGFAGVMNGMAQGRFSASINQAPMERHAGGIISDWVHNRVEFHKSDALPPAHLLRQVFETAASYDEAKELLSKTPVSVPVIYTLAGTKAGEGCVIERLENDYAVREMAQNGTAVSTTNHFQTVLSYLGSYWMERSNHSRERYEQSKSFTAEGLTKDFNWFSYPVANEFTRLVMTANAKTGELTVMGTAGEVPTTQVFKL